MNASTLTPQDVLNFWFDKTKSTDENIQFWFSGDAKADEAIREKFASAVEQASQGEFSEWQKTSDGSLALILLLDQFPLNIYRGQKKSFETIRKALPIATKSLSLGFDSNRTVYERLFFYLPFEHAEDRTQQKRSVDLFKNLAAQAKLEDKKSAHFFEKYAVDHFTVIERFGRFPTWN